MVPRIRQFVLAILPLLAVPLHSQDLKSFEKRVTDFALPNGMRFLVLERHEAPVVAFNAYVNAGSVDDPAGQTNMAHMFEHMIGKGTTDVGSKNWAQERKALERVEQAYDRVEEERRKGPHPDPAKLKELEAKLRDDIETANSFVEANAYIRVIEEQGAGNTFNAGTSTDSTTYFYSLPSNKTELWFLLSSEWFKRPVFREFYKERDVVREERRMRTESSTQGKLVELLLATAFVAHPYHNPTAGWASDIDRLRAKNAEKFYQTYYAPANITVAIVGDVTAAQVKKYAEKYFASLPARPLPPPVEITEPKQEGERRATLETNSQPFLLIAYKRPEQTAADDPVFDVIDGILSGGRTGELYKSMVRDSKIALAVECEAGFPGGKYPNLFLVFDVPSAGHTVEENEKAIYAELDKLKTQKVDAETLERVKTKLRAGLIRRLDSNTGLAAQLPYYQVAYGDWRVMFTGLELLQKVTAEDVQRVAQKYFRSDSRTVVHTVKVPADTATPKTGEVGQ